MKRCGNFGRSWHWFASPVDSNKITQTGKTILMAVSLMMSASLGAQSEICVPDIFAKTTFSFDEMEQSAALSPLEMGGRLTERDHALLSVPLGLNNPDQSVVDRILSTAPIHAIGKITTTDNPSEKALCTAAMVGNEILVTSANCLQNKGGQFFIPYLGKSMLVGMNGIRVHGLPIVSYGFMKEILLPQNIIVNPIGVALMGSQLKTGYFALKASGGPFEEAWKNTNNYSDMGYSKNNPTSLILKSGISVKGTTENTICQTCCCRSFHYYNLKLHTEPSNITYDFIEGAALIGYFCGKWQIIGVYNGIDFIDISSAVDPLVEAYNSAGHYTSQTSGGSFCNTPAVPRIR
jgi:hypothetical protein